MNGSTLEGYMIQSGEPSESSGLTQEQVTHEVMVTRMLATSS